jgi:hypothetical protein
MSKPTEYTVSAHERARFQHPDPSRTMRASFSNAWDKPARFLLYKTRAEMLAAYLNHGTTCRGNACSQCPRPMVGI